MKKIKLLVVLKNFEINGISMVVMNYCKNMDLSKFEVTIAVGKPINNTFVKTCENLGINIIELPKKKSISYYLEFYKKIKKNYFDIIHVHGNSSLMFFELLIGLFKGIKVRIAHCHNSSCANITLHKIFLPLFKMVANNNFACSDLAGKWLFKDNYTVIPNGFEVDKFKFNKEIRKKVRKELNLDDNAFVIGHVGRFNSQKNQRYMIELLKKLDKKNVYLLLVGDGPDFKDISKEISDLKLNIILYNETTCPQNLYSAMDLFILPSKYEGLGIVLLEAQINGLDCIVSSNVPSSAKITNNVEFLELENYPYSKWIKSLKTSIKNKNRNNVDINDPLIQNYNIKNNVNNLEKKYIELLKKR